MNPDMSLQNFCRNITVLRQKHKLSQKELSKILHISTRSVRLLERGIVPPKLDCAVLISIQTHFHIRPSEMFAENGIV